MLGKGLQKEKSMVKASFVLSVFNGVDTLADALESALAQTMRDFELVAIDDGSTDDSFAVLNLYASRDSRITVLRNTHNIGVANSLNRAIHIARSSYIARLDHDDINISTRLEQQIKVLDDNPQIGVVSCFVDPLFSQDASTSARTKVAEFERRRRNLAHDPEKLCPALLNHNIFHHGEVVYRRSLWQQVGGYRPAFTMAEDYDLWLRMSAYTTFHIIPQTLYIRRFGKTNTTRVYSDMMRFAANLARECHALRIANHSDEEYARSQFMAFLAEHDLMHQFAHYIDDAQLLCAGAT
jgi:glycosyltransferase involved in cell wall biosynthesis